MQFIGVVVVEASDKTKAIAQWACDETSACGGTDEREPRKVEANGTRGRALAQHNVELKIFHCGVKHFFDIAAEAMDLIDEQDIAFA